MTHTPGPWEARNVYIMCDHRKDEIHGRKLAQAMGRFDCQETIANAALIAAAPDMLAALKIANQQLEEFSSTIQRGDDPALFDAMEQANAAIAKAQGGAA